jgi:hypothetical protein
MDSVLTYLAQSRPAGTSAVTLYSPTQPQQPILKRIWIVNTSAGTAKYSLYFDNDGTTYDQTTAVAYQIQLGAGVTEYIDLEIPMNVSTGNFAIQTSVASAFNFTLFGEL